MLGLAEAVVGDALVAGFFFFPELSSTGAAAKRVFTVAWELSGVAEDMEEIAGCVVDTVVAAQVAGIVIGDGRIAGGGRELFGRD